ncbi:MAG: hypothetical protein AAF907_10860, partial [Planctomycetota bacterium]
VKTLPDWKFFLGLVMAATGAVLVMVFKPTDPSKTPPAAKAAVTESAPAEPAPAMTETAAIP